ncbi:XRE family transcriptional regulator [Aquabacterium soli]|uniref:XRE family transcriptional regulator n=1 Tax=Aquabacterium soli TaxID=2493092 RepID=A0A426V2L6_9BURK|nr:helix-turn-helix transcriptional regulator [Aquabacterium soli]RRS01060.1 XRE family transcriptional regulator [Aquabacterium soli]
MKRRAVILPSAREQLEELGLRLRLARERRGISQVLAAERVGCSRETLRRLEAGDPSVSLGTVLRVLRVLQLDADINSLAADTDLIGKLDDLAARGIQVGGARRSRA